MYLHKEKDISTQTHLLMRHRIFNLGMDSESRTKLDCNTELLSSPTNTESHTGDVAKARRSSY